MPDALTWAEWALASAALLVLLVVVFLFVRRRWLSHRGWVFDCSLRRLTTTPSSGWMLGVARLNGEQFEWYRVFSASSHPKVVLRRGGTQVVSSRGMEPRERAILYDQVRITELRAGDTAVEVALSSANMTALLSWLEAAPPGLDYR